MGPGGGVSDSVSLPPCPRGNGSWGEDVNCIMASDYVRCVEGRGKGGSPGGSARVALDGFITLLRDPGVLTFLADLVSDVFLLLCDDP